MNGQTYYFLDGTTDWLKTAVKTVVVYKDYYAVHVKSIAARRTQKKYFARTMLKIQHEMWADSTKTGKAAEILFDREDVVCDGGKGIKIPFTYGKIPEESLTDMAELSDMERLDFFKLSDALKVLEANLLAYNLMCAGGYDG